MKYSNVFKTIYWLVIVFFLTLILIFRMKGFFSGNINNFDILVFIFWFSLLVFPLIKEVNILGVSFKKEIEDVKREVRDSIYSLKMEIKNNVNVNPSFNLNIGKANMEEREKKAVDDAKEDKVERVIADEQNAKTKEELFKERIIKINNVEKLVFEKFSKKYNDNFAPQIKIQSSVGKKIIIDGGIFEGGKLKEVIEIKFIRAVSFDALKFIGIRFVEKVVSFGVKTPVRFVIVSEEMNKEKAHKIKEDFAYIDKIKKLSRDSIIPELSFEFYKYISLRNEIIKVKA